MNSFEDWYDENLRDLLKGNLRGGLMAAWEAAQKDLIRKAWNMYGEDLAEGLMELVGITADCPPEESDDV
jgi:hypothetical protein